MRPSVPRGNKKPAEKPVIVTNVSKIKPKISERTIRMRKEAKEKQLQPGKFASGLNICGIIFLYFCLILCVLVGIGGIVVCALYFNVSSDTQSWKIVGIVLGAITLIIGIILIALTIFKQTRNRPWQYKKTKIVSSYDNEFFSDDDDAVENIDDSDDDMQHGSASRRSAEKSNVANAASSENGTKREMAVSPIGGSLFDPLQRQTQSNEMIFCPGCNRFHPSAHQCMYSTHLANGLGHSMRPTPRALAHDSIAIQTDDEIEKKKKKGPHTVIDRSLKYSYTTETQTDVTAKPGANTTESIILRRVPIPTAKVVVQQPTTKVMIVKVPNTAGQLVIQPKTSDSNFQTD